MAPHPKRRASNIRPDNPGTGGKPVRRNDIRASDLPHVARALGINVDQVIETAKRLTREATEGKNK